MRAEGPEAPGELVAARVIGKRPTLKDDQREMVRRLLVEPEGVAVVIGEAGTSKTYATVAATEGWAAAGMELYAGAPTWRAADVLRREGLDKQEMYVAASRSRGETRPWSPGSSHRVGEGVPGRHGFPAHRPPAYITKELGERPSDPEKRRSWEAGVRTIEGFRQEHGVKDRDHAFGSDTSRSAERAREQARQRLRQSQRELGRVKEVARVRDAGRSLGIGL